MAAFASIPGCGRILFLDGRGPGDPLVQQTHDRLSRRFSPEAQLRLDPEHVLFRSFYILDRPMGRLTPPESGRALVQDGRLAVVATHVDLAGALARDAFGAWSFDLPQQDRVRGTVRYQFGDVCLVYRLQGGSGPHPLLLKRRR